MLSMINPETLSKIEGSARYSSINAQRQNQLYQSGGIPHGIARMSQDSQEVLYHDEAGDTMPEAPLTKPQTAAHGVKVKTMSNFYT